MYLWSRSSNVGCKCTYFSQGSSITLSPRDWKGVMNTLTPPSMQTHKRCQAQDVARFLAFPSIIVSLCLQFPALSFRSIILHLVQQLSPSLVPQATTCIYLSESRIRNYLPVKLVSTCRDRASLQKATPEPCIDFINNFIMLEVLHGCGMGVRVGIMRKPKIKKILHFIAW